MSTTTDNTMATTTEEIVQAEEVPIVEDTRGKTKKTRAKKTIEDAPAGVDVTPKGKGKKKINAKVEDPKLIEEEPIVEEESVEPSIFGKNELVDCLVKKYPDTTATLMKKVVDTIFDEITTRVTAGNTVKIHNFGRFQRRLRQARVCNHPKDKEKKIQVPATYAVGFEVFAKFKNMVKTIPVASST